MCGTCRIEWTISAGKILSALCARTAGLALAAGVTSAGVNYAVQTACHPDDVKTYDTTKLRERFVMEKVMVPDEINVTYTMYDRLIYGGAVPVTKML